MSYQSKYFLFKNFDRTFLIQEKLEKVAKDKVNVEVMVYHMQDFSFFMIIFSTDVFFKKIISHRVRKGI